MVLPFLAPLAPLAPVLSGGAAAGGAGAAGGIAAGQVLRTVVIAASGISLANPVGIAIVAGSIVAPIAISKGVAAVKGMSAASPPPPPPPPPGFFLPSGEEIALEQMIIILKAVKKVLDTYETLKEAEEKDQSPLIALLKSELKSKIVGELIEIVLDPKFLRASLKVAKNIDNKEVEVFGKRLIKALK